MRSRWLALLGLIVAALLVGFLQSHSGGNDPGQPPGESASAPRVAGETIAESDLPDEARETLALIDSDGPYPYRQDDTVFGNRERLLPAKPGGY